MDTTLEDQSESTFDDFQEWTNPPKKGGTSYDPMLFSNLEESARTLVQACIMAYGIRFDTSAISKLYEIIEEGIIKIRQRKEENDLQRIGEAQKNLVDFINQIAHTAYDQKLTSINAKEINAMRLQFCPVYPFT